MEHKKRTAKSHELEGHKMTHQEAGHLGGIAHHKCRGRECGESKSKSGKSTGYSKASSNMNGSNNFNSNDENND